jgi:predicted neutral ceramidase superfamily lipid hydrolase
MSVSAVTEPAEADSAREFHALAFRIAFAASMGLTLGEAFGWDFPFLPAMLAVQLLSSREPLSVKKGVAFVAVIVSASVFAVLVAQVFVDSPFVLLLAVSLVTFLAFLVLARGQAIGVAAAFLITTAVVPLLAIESVSVAHGFIYSLIAGSALAVLLTFAVQAFFPMPVQTRPASATEKNSNATAVALANATVLMSLVIYFILTVSPVPC